jgi:hypothetical protein
MAALDGEEGYTSCWPLVVGENTYCMMGDTFCTVIDAGGGGGGGGVGGYGGECTIDQAAVCPPSCGACHRV